MVMPWSFWCMFFPRVYNDDIESADEGLDQNPLSAV